MWENFSYSSQISSIPVFLLSFWNYKYARFLNIISQMPWSCAHFKKKVFLSFRLEIYCANFKFVQSLSLSSLFYSYAHVVNSYFRYCIFQFQDVQLVLHYISVAPLKFPLFICHIFLSFFNIVRITALKSLSATVGEQ